MVTEKQMNAWFQKLYDKKAIYVWAMNGDIIDAETIDYAYKHHSSKQYDRAYYLAKLKEGKGHIGADCSGSFYRMSGFDTTAHGYYTKCIEKGSISTLPKYKPCMVFFNKSGTNIMGHIGWYMGNGYVIEMRSSKANCTKTKLDSRWKYWGIPNFVEYTDSEVCNVELSILRKGDKGNEVKTAQRLLKAMGYSVGLSGADGDFGKNTEKAVLKFQKKYGLEQDGIVGQKTWEKLLK